MALEDYVQMSECTKNVATVSVPVKATCKCSELSHHCIMGRIKWRWCLHLFSKSDTRTLQGFERLSEFVQVQCSPLWKLSAGRA